ncbi:MAG TPA: YceI family protein [Cytophagaceae bacterium]|jgi:polyisoprenoid-binding protein YceI
MEHLIEKAVWGIDKSHTSINFSISHFMIARVSGHFGDFEGTLIGSNDSFESVDLTIRAASINTNDVNRDNHLKTPDFFDVAQFPDIRFVSTSLEKISDNRYSIKGLLTVNGIEKPLTLDATYAGAFEHPVYKKMIAVFEVNAEIPRLDFNIGANYPGAALGEVVKLNSSMELALQ